MKNALTPVYRSACNFARKIKFADLRGRLVALLVLLGLTALATFSTTSYAERLANKFSSSAMQKSAVRLKPGKATLTVDKGSYLAGETITFSGNGWAAGEAVTITISADVLKEVRTVQVTADKSGAFTATALMPEVGERFEEKEREAKRGLRAEAAEEESSGSFTATATGASSKTMAQARFSLGIAERDGDRLLEQEGYWMHRLSYPTGQFNPAWVRQAAEHDARIARRVPAGRKMDLKSLAVNPLALSPTSFTALGPRPLRMTGCSGCFDYTTTEGRVNAIAIDPTTTTNGSIVAYIATVGGGVWKTTNCCSGTTTWNPMTDDALISTTSVDSVVIDPNNHNTIYAGTGDLNFGSFSMGSQGILKSTDGGANWTVLGASVFGAALPQPAGNFPQYQAVGKVRVDPNDSNKIVAGTKTGLYLSYDAGVNWAGPCLTNAFNTMRQDITGLELSNISGTTRIIAAVGVRGFATTVQYNLDQNGANGIYKGTVPASGCPTDFVSITDNTNGFVFGTAVTGSPYTTGQNMNATSGTVYGGLGVGNQIGRVDIAVAPSDPNYIYAQVASIAPNNNAGCGNAAGCQIGVWVTTNGGTSWTFMAGSAGGSLRNCAGGNTSGNPGDYPQNWYNAGMAVDPNNPDRVYVDTYDTWLANRTGTSFYNTTCGYNGSAASAHVVHVDHHALAFVPGSSSILLEGSDGGIFSTTNADAAVIGSVRPTWVNMDTNINTIEFYSGDISGNFANAAAPQANGGAQDNGSMSVTFTGSPTGPVQWQMGRGGDGFTARIDPVGTGTSLRMWQGNNSGSLGRCISNCTASGATWTTKNGGWLGVDTQNFVLPYDLFHGGIPGGDDCPAAAAGGGCGRLIVGTTRVWETITGNASGAAGTVTWVVSNNPITGNLTKGTLGNRSFINQIKYSPKFQSVAILGTNDGNVQIGFNLGTGVAAAGNWVNVTGGNAVLPNRPVMGIALDPTVAVASQPVGYAAMGGFDQNTPTTPGHVFRVDCSAANCASFTWADKSGNLPNIPVDSIIVNPNFPQQVFAGTDFGLYFTDDVNVASPIWYRFNNGLPNTMIWDMQIDRGSTTLSLWTRSRGAFVWPLPNQRVNLLAQTITVNTPAPATATHGSQFTVAATASSGLPVSYSSSGSCTNSGPTFTMTSGTGACNVMYNQAGDANYSPAPQVTEVVTAEECASPTNVALASYGATAVASTTANASFLAGGAIDGEHNGNTWGSNGGWNDRTRGIFPDDIQVNLNVMQTFGEIDVYTLKNDFNSGSVVNDTTTFSLYGITNFNVQYWTGAAWVDVPGGAVTGNTLVKRKFVFPDITTDKVRVVVNDSADHLYSRVVEIEVFSCVPAVVPPPSPTPTPTPTPCASPSNNIALATAGSMAVASSTANASFLAGGAIDGEHNGNTWGSNGGWNDRTRGVFPDDIQVNFVAPQTIREIDVYTLKDDFNSGSIVNDSTTFTAYGITSFNVQYWTGAAWADVPGGAVTGNNLVKRKFVFGDITTDKIRVVVNDSADHLYSRIVEIEAFACSPAPFACVNPGGTGGCFASIQAAHDAVTTVPGTNVLVYPGSYSENVVITKSIKLLGAQHGIDARGRSAPESTVSPLAAATATFLLNSSMTTAVVDGFTFTGGTSLGVIQTQSGSDFSNLLIANNRFSGYSQSAVFMNRGGANITIDRNVIDGSSIAGSGQAIFGNGPQTFAGLFVTNNNIVNNTGRYGLFIDGNHNVGESATRAPLISGNLFDNNLQGLNLGSRSFGTLAAPVLGPYGGSITNNTFSNHAANGIQGGLQHVLVSGNIFSNNAISGLALTSFGNTGADRGGQNSNITCNRFAGNLQEGMFFSASQGAGLIGTNVFNNNNLVGNFVGVTYNGTETIDGTNNWWNSASGPTIATNPTGTGDKITNASGGFTYAPFLAAAAPCAP